MRVHELAKALDISSKDCIARLHELGVEVKSHASTVDEAIVQKLMAGHGQAAAPAPAAPAATPAPAAATAPAAPAVAVKPPAPPAPTPKVAPPAAPPTSPEPAAKPVAKVEPVVVKPATPVVPPAPVAMPKPPPPPPPPAKPEVIPGERAIHVKGPVVVRDLAEALGMRPNAVIAELMGMNILASITQKVDVAVARAVAEKHGYTLEHDKRSTEHKVVVPKKATETREDEERPEDLQPRPPVVTFLGHVDHGKTSLLDRIRKASVVEDEFGGITQHIGAYTVNLQGRQITFLDTPGHAAFTAMRARGANLTDIAVIVIAADDGIMPQTREAIQHALAADVTIMVAINKIDLPTANVERVRRQLQAENLSPEDWGGQTICCPVSAQTGAGIDHLLEMILLQSDLLELRANPHRRATGYVIEAKLEHGMGPTANLLVTTGTLKIGDVILCGPHCGRVRALINDHGTKVKSAEPSTPVKCLGLPGVPEAGAEFRVYANERLARQMASDLSEQLKQKHLASPKKVSLENLFSQLEGEKKLDLRVVLKADTQGSIEAIHHALKDIRSEKISLTIMLGSTGNITENDVMLASASQGVILGFCVGKEVGVDSLARREGVDIRMHNIIYELLDEVRDAMTGLLAPELKETVVGTAQILEVFPIGKTSRVAGCRVIKGTIAARNKVRVRRGDEVLYQGSIASLKHFQESVAEVRESQECGIRLDRFTAFDKGDLLEFYTVEEVRQTL
ncbi:MAG: translation initiation factor IF-2 [Lentisphaerae bacterium]|nr:translation initiation factor IF-2 [Lentisphaerota bacterium]